MCSAANTPTAATRLFVSTAHHMSECERRFTLKLTAPKEEDAEQLP